MIYDAASWVSLLLATQPRHSWFSSVIDAPSRHSCSSVVSSWVPNLWTDDDGDDVELLTHHIFSSGSHRKTRSARNAWSRRPTSTSSFFAFFEFLNEFQLSSMYSFSKCSNSTRLRVSSGSPRKGGTSWNQRKPRGSQSEYNQIKTKPSSYDQNRVTLVFVEEMNWPCRLCLDLNFLSLTLFRDPVVLRELLATLVLVVSRSVHSHYWTQLIIDWHTAQILLCFIMKCVIFGLQGGQGIRGLKGHKGEKVTWLYSTLQKPNHSRPFFQRFHL